MEENKKIKKSTFPLPPKKKKNKGVGRWIAFIWIGLIGTILGIVGVFFAISEGFLGEMPDTSELENPDIYVASEVLPK